MSDLTLDILACIGQAGAFWRGMAEKLERQRDSAYAELGAAQATISEQANQLAARDAEVAELRAALEHIDRAWSAFQDDPPTTRCVGGYPVMRVTISVESWARLMTAMDMHRALLARTPEQPAEGV